MAESALTPAGPSNPPMTPTGKANASTTNMTAAASSGGVVLSETQLGNMALRAKQQRLKAEQDRQLLQNRINRLVIEQEKAQKRIEETNRRAIEIKKLKQRNEAHADARRDASAWLASERELQRELLKENREQQAKAIMESRKAVHSLKQDEVKVLKLMRHENEEAVMQQREMERNRALARKKVVRDSQRFATERKQMENEALLQRLKEKREEKRQQVDADSMVHLEAYSSLAEEEQKLIESLAKWNRIQTDAHEQLDTVLSNSKAASRAASRPVTRQTDSDGGPPTAAPAVRPETAD
uniref:Uncharacterized protein n=1 Tax=Haptolina brevifila TaxID=156173 RepID=A0A7S2E324_9EUKA|mmetsp:Transcript_47486/g.94835  ORF Transcript_47486/g.94835 Transcript_47486/m.94835 type:complete len:298 (+) Transcript_47486:18-911(+)|eukprot:CAMPEP_0174705490 /NCGR_PEP_ID=MMETSP1094-20130205/8698_1 /TAXON_ID=156173 /ORGANISM="Chrysochromulina brevifilum, Strain UTEX LB 985" /LENGTH=297 /DNA_ID=CAMNT_0015903663 /DNA_START=17 /DNA_END=910 /DNA_ORIENTATION=+